MVRQIVEYLLGPLGVQVLQFYISNSLVINCILFLYGMVLLLAYANYRRIKNTAISTVQERLAGKKQSNSQTLETKTATSPEFTWQEIIDKASFFPLIAHGKSIIPRLTRPSNMEILSSASELVSKVLDDWQITQQG